MGKTISLKSMIATQHVCRLIHITENRLAVTTLRTPDARSAQSNIVIVRFQSYAPTLRCRCVATTRLQPFGKGNDFSPAHQGQGTLFEIGDIEF